MSSSKCFETVVVELQLSSVGRHWQKISLSHNFLDLLELAAPNLNPGGLTGNERPVRS